MSPNFNLVKDTLKLQENTYENDYDLDGNDKTVRFEHIFAVATKR